MGFHCDGKLLESINGFTQCLGHTFGNDPWKKPQLTPEFWWTFEHLWDIVWLMFQTSNREMGKMVSIVLLRQALDCNGLWQTAAQTRSVGDLSAKRLCRHHSWESWNNDRGDLYFVGGRVYYDNKILRHHICMSISKAVFNSLHVNMPRVTSSGPAEFNLVDSSMDSVKCRLAALFCLPMRRWL